MASISDLSQSLLAEILRNTPPSHRLVCKAFKEAWEIGDLTLNPKSLPGQDGYLQTFSGAVAADIGCFMGIRNSGLDSLELLTNLRTLSLRRFSELTDYGLSNLRGLSELRRLDIWRSPYSSRNHVTDIGVGYLAELDQLRSLNLENCNVTDKGVSRLGSLSALETLSLSGCKDITGESLRGFSRLRVLRLSGCSSFSAVHLQKLTALQVLDLSEASDALEGASLATLTALTKLDMSDTQVTDEVLRTLPGSLQELELRGCDKVTDEGVGHLSGLVALRRLNLRFCGITDRGLSHMRCLTSLQCLLLTACPIGDEGLRHLLPLQALRVLDLRDCDLTDVGAAHLLGLGALEQLVLFCEKITRLGLDPLRDVRRWCV